jgi:hypothetical protein
VPSVVVGATIGQCAKSFVAVYIPGLVQTHEDATRATERLVVKDLRLGQNTPLLRACGYRNLLIPSCGDDEMMLGQSEIIESLLGSGGVEVKVGSDSSWQYRGCPHRQNPAKYRTIIEQL